MVATQNIDTLGPNWIFSPRGVLTFVASGLGWMDGLMDGRMAGWTDKWIYGLMG